MQGIRSASAVPAHEDQPTNVDKQPRLRSARDRARARGAALQEKAARIAQRAQSERSRHSSVDAAFEMADRDAEVGGGIMAGALAYRLFIWLLPLALVLIAGLGFASDAAHVAPDDAARDLGLAGLVTNSVAGSAKSSARWYALLVGVPILLLATRSVLRTLVVTHRLVWTDLRSAAPRPTVVATLKLLAALTIGLGISVAASAIRHASIGDGVIATLLIPVPYAVLWLFVSMNLPHRDAPWRSLVPGAIVFGVGIEVLHAITAYFIAPQVASKEGTYGALGTAAALLLGLFLLSRVIVATAVTNATLWDRRSSRTPSTRKHLANDAPEIDLRG